VSSDPHRLPHRARALPVRLWALLIPFFVIAGGAVIWVAKSHPTVEAGVDTALSSQSKRLPGVFYPTPAQWTTLKVEPVQQYVFRSEQLTEGKIVVDEDRSTLIFSPYAGRVTTLFVKPGDVVERGQPLFTVQATDMVQAQNDLVAAVTTLSKARSALNLAQIVDKRMRLLYEGKAVPLKEVQQARAALDAAENDARSSEAGLEAARSRLTLLGKTDQEIADFQDRGTINPSTTIYAPIAGTIVQRKVGPGQYIGSGASEPVFVIGDLSTVWLVAYIRETEAALVRIGQPLNFTVLANPDRVHSADISFVASALDPNTRRLLVRAALNNAAGLLKPEMFARVSIFTGKGETALAVPREAVIYDGDAARIWVARDDKAIELRRIKLGLTNGNMVQVLHGLASGDRVITQGSIFIGRVAAST
jgi:cobalt-zinc-cadmium efflux system membrane fusion protein